jgi:hypothetical protein
VQPSTRGAASQLCVLIKHAIHEAQEKGGRRPCTPAFRTVGDEVITFHDLEAEDGIFAPVIDRGTDEKE